MQDSQKLLKVNKEIDQWLNGIKKIADELRAKRDPREQFNRWKQTLEGRQWKKTQYTKQEGECGICHHPMPLKGSHIDHIKPISTYPELSLEPDNMRLLCPECNTQKGTRL